MRFVKKSYPLPVWIVLTGLMILVIQAFLLALKVRPVIDFEINLLSFLGIKPGVMGTVFILLLLLVGPLILKYYNDIEKSESPPARDQEAKSNEQKNQSTLSKIFGFLLSLFSGCFLFYIFIYGNFPGAWIRPTESRGLAGMFCLMAGIIILISFIIPKMKGARWSMGGFLLCLSGFYFIVFLVRTFIWTKI